MRKLSLLFILAIAMASFTPWSFADDTVAPDTNNAGESGMPIVPPTPPAAPTPAPSTLNELNTQKSSKEASLQSAQNDEEAAEEALSDAQRSGDANRIQAAQRVYDAKRQQVRTLQNDISEIEDEIEQNPEYKMSAISQKYNDLITTTKSQGQSIQKKIDECKAPCAEEQILAMQLKANAAYVKYLESRREFEICSVDAGFCGTPIAVLDQAQKDDANSVKDILATLTSLETTRNTERTFDVSGVFTLPGQDVSERSIQDVVDTLANWMIILASSLAVTALIIGGFMMIISGGDENRLELGKTIFTYSLMGLFVTLMAFGIVTFLQSLFY
jgi:hypothetical protein